MTDLVEGIRAQGRPAKPVFAEVVRELTLADLAALDAPRDVKPPSLKKIRDHHHLIARLMAEGKRTSEIAEITGIGVSRVSIYRNDPAFTQLVEFYKEKVEEVRDAAFTDTVKKLAALNNDAIEELHDRLIEEPEKINNDQLLDVIKATSDRTGFGPQTKSTNVNVNVDLAGRVAAGRERASRLGAGLSPTLSAPVLEGEVVAASDSKPSSTEGPG